MRTSPEWPPLQNEKYSSSWPGGTSYLLKSTASPLASLGAAAEGADPSFLLQADRPMESPAPERPTRAAVFRNLRRLRSGGVSSVLFSSVMFACLPVSKCKRLADSGKGDKARIDESGRRPRRPPAAATY